MESLLWLVLLCMIVGGVLAALGLCRRMQHEDLPRVCLAAVVLWDIRTLGRQLRALEAQTVWMDSALTAQIWLIDATPDQRLGPVCLAFCRKHPGFFYCPLGEVEKNLQNRAQHEKNDCNLSKNQV